MHRNAPQTVTPQQLKVQGTLPPWLNGVMYRIGPGKFHLGEGGAAIALNHAFDGLSLMHRFELHGSDNDAVYRSRYLTDDYEKDLLETQGRGAVFFGHSIEMTTWQRIKDTIARLDRLLFRPPKATASSRNVSVTVTPNYPAPKDWKSNEPLILVSKTDASALQKVNRETLEPEKVFEYSSYDKELTGPFSAAHHMYDYETKETMNVSINFAGEQWIKVFSIKPDGTTQVLATVKHALNEAKTPVRAFYCHSFFASSNYVIVPESPLVVRNNGLDFLLNGNIQAGLEWEAHTPTRLHVIDRHGGKGHVATFEVPAYFAFHIANAVDRVDDKGRVHIDLDCCAYSGEMLYEAASFGDLARSSDFEKYKQHQSQEQTLYNGVRMPPARFSQFGEFRRLHLEWHPDTVAQDTKQPVAQTVLASNVEFPRINVAHCMKSYTYAYGCQLTPPTANTGERYDIVKINVQTGELVTYQQEDLRHAYMSSEPIFVARPGSEKEDDGVVLSLVSVLDEAGPAQDRCFLIVLDAASFTKIATIPVGDFVATTFHGSFHDEHSFELGSFN
ncbi:carotenoid oxygenase [Gongronella butleri]|nr:carotenoid oxygenase [Gongronella butleri]